MIPYNFNYAPPFCSRARHDPNERDANGSSPLHHACWGGHLACFRELLRRGGDWLAVNAQGDTCLHLLFENAHAEAIDWVVEGGAAALGEAARRERGLRLGEMVEERLVEARRALKEAGVGRVSSLNVIKDPVEMNLLKACLPGSFFQPSNLSWTSPSDSLMATTTIQVSQMLPL